MCIRDRMITADMVGDGAVVADVGINVDESGNLCGDVDFDAVEPVSYTHLDVYKRQRWLMMKCVCMSLL